MEPAEENATVEEEEEEEEEPEDEQLATGPDVTNDAEEDDSSSSGVTTATSITAAQTAPPSSATTPDTKSSTAAAGNNGSSDPAAAAAAAMAALSATEAEAVRAKDAEIAALQKALEAALSGLPPSVRDPELFSATTGAHLLRSLSPDAKRQQQSPSQQQQKRRELPTGMQWESWPLIPELNEAQSLASGGRSKRVAGGGGHDSNFVQRLPLDDLILFGKTPLDDPLELVKCLQCGQVLRPARFSLHYDHCTKEAELFQQDAEQQQQPPPPQQQQPPHQAQQKSGNGGAPPASTPATGQSQEGMDEAPAKRRKMESVSKSSMAEERIVQELIHRAKTLIPGPIAERLVPRTSRLRRLYQSAHGRSVIPPDAPPVRKGLGRGVPMIVAPQLVPPSVNSGHLVPTAQPPAPSGRGRAKNAAGGPAKSRSRGKKANVAAAPIPGTAPIVSGPTPAGSVPVPTSAPGLSASVTPGMDAQKMAALAAARTGRQVFEALQQAQIQQQSQQQQQQPPPSFSAAVIRAQAAAMASPPPSQQQYLPGQYIPQQQPPQQQQPPLDQATIHAIQQQQQQQHRGPIQGMIPPQGLAYAPPPPQQGGYPFPAGRAQFRQLNGQPPPQYGRGMQQQQPPPPQQQQPQPPMPYVMVQQQQQQLAGGFGRGQIRSAYTFPGNSATGPVFQTATVVTGAGRAFAAQQPQHYMPVH